MKKTLLLCLGATLLITFKAVLAETKVLVVDPNKVIKNTTNVENAKNKLTKQFDPRIKAFQEQEKQFQNDLQLFNKNSATMKPEEKKAAETRLMELQKKLQENASSLQGEISNAQNTAMKEILTSMQEVVKQVAIEQKANIVINKTEATISYHQPELDISDLVIQKMKAKASTGSIITPPAPASTAIVPVKK